MNAYARMIAFALVAVCILGQPSAASARHVPSDSLKLVVAQTLGLPAGCGQAYESDVDANFFTFFVDADVCDDYDPVGVVQYTPGVGYAGNDCPVAGTTEDVSEDLQICIFEEPEPEPKPAAKPAPLLAKVLCLPTKSRTYVRHPQSRPRHCDTLGLADALCCAFNLVNISWKHWGQATAFAFAIDKGYHLPFSHIPVHVTAYRLRKACAGVAVYTRIRSTSRYGSFTQKVEPDCNGPTLEDLGV